MLSSPTAQEIADGLVTDHCCTLSLEVLRKLGIGNRIVTLEAHVRRFPGSISEGYLYGVGDVIQILAGRDVAIWSMKPGAQFFEREPVLVLEGTAEALATIRPAITGALTFGSSVLTRARAIVQAAEKRTVHFFGSRKIHPIHVRQYLECAYVGGMEINAAPQAAAVLPTFRLEDCQEHFANLVADKPEDSWTEFLTLPADRGSVFIVLDNSDDPVVEAKRAVATLGDRLHGILIDTDSTRRGDINAIIAEVAWHLRLIGRSDVRISLTGGISQQVIERTKEYVYSYGVGLSALEGPLFDFALQVVAVDGQPKAKLGVRPGKKAVFICSKCRRRDVDDFDGQPTCCEAPMSTLLTRATDTFASDLELVREDVRRTMQ